MTDPTIRTDKLSKFRPTLHNPNAHTKRGLVQLEESMEEDGYIAPMTVAADGESLDGSARMEVAFEKFGDEALVVEHDGTKPIVMVRTDIPNANTRQARRIITRANQVAAVDLQWDADVMAAWREEDNTVFDGIFFDNELDSLGVELDLSTDLDNEEEEEEEPEPIFPGDIIFPTDNEWGVPVLLPSMQAVGVVAPFNRWGTEARAKRMRGTYHFYTDDYRFSGIWREPDKLVISGCQCVIEPNFSTNNQMARAVVLWHVYRKRWLARYWQECGVRVFVDLALAPAHRDLALLGVPKGWRAYATYSYTANYDPQWLEDDWRQAVERAGTEEIVFLVYGGEEDFGRQCKERGWLWYPAHQQAVLRNVGATENG